MQPIPRDQATLDIDGAITAVKGYAPLKGDEFATIDQELSSYKVPVGGGKAIQPQGFDSALVLEPTYRYDSEANTFTRIKDGVVFKDDGLGWVQGGERGGDRAWLEDLCRTAQLRPHHRRAR